jgi:hypothetical protein
MRLLAVLIAATTLLPALAGAQAPPWLLRVDAAVRYDDNVLRYSDLYLEAFRRSEDPGRFHIGSTDDVILNVGLRLEREILRSGDLRTTLFGDGSYARYMRNTTKNWGSVGAGIRQNLPFRSLLTIAYEYVPYFYIRHYRDEDWVDAGYVGPEAYQPYSYARDELRASLAATFPTATGVRFGVAGGRQYHNEHFTEYDARTTSWLWEVSQRAGQVRLSARYEYETARALVVTPGRSDASYDEDQYIAGVTYAFPVFGRNAGLEASGAYARRCYTTTSPVELDPLHAGRVDHALRISLGAQMTIMRQLDVGLTASWRSRDAAGVPANDAYISLERDYTQFQIEATASYAVRF